jgi:protocatechuate 4,5-dioxygenase beta chain
MPIVLGLASSHAPSMFSPAEAWPQIHKGLVRDVPQPKRLAEETPEVIADYVRRINASFAAIKARLEAAKIDAVLLVGDDQTEVFTTACIPAIGIFTGEEASGTTSISWIGQKPEDNHITIKNNPALAKMVLRELVARDFDPSYSEVLKPLGKPTAGIGHAFSRIARAAGLAEKGTPTIPIFLNGYHPPQPTGRRCYDLGKALRDIFENRPERIAIYGSGGMSHCPVGPRAGWVDEPLDRWVLEQIETGRGEQLQNLFTFDSDTMRSGTGELRSWITVAGAFEGKRGEVLDYMPAIHAVTGLGFAAWTR